LPPDLYKGVETHLFFAVRKAVYTSPQTFVAEAFPRTNEGIILCCIQLLFLSQFYLPLLPFNFEFKGKAKIANSKWCEF
jgi:hypothetical protein